MDQVKVKVSEQPNILLPEWWEKSGEGYTSDSYFSLDGTLMLKLYYDFFPFSDIENEQKLSSRIFDMGIPSPKVGDIIKLNGRNGLVFQRIVGKRSFSRAIADETEDAEKYAKIFANMCKKLHNTPCDKTLFPSFTQKMDNFIKTVKGYSKAEINKIRDFLYVQEDTGTCLHGDLHIGNALITKDATYFIDLGDFCYGNPLFDFGGMFCLGNVVGDKNLESFHNTGATLHRVWVAFVKEYFGLKTEEEYEKKNEELTPFSVFQLLMWLDKYKSKNLQNAVYKLFLDRV